MFKKSIVYASCLLLALQIVPNIRVSQTIEVSADTVQNDYDINTLTEQISNYMLSTVSNPVHSSIGGEWVVIQLARSENLTPEYTASYLKSLDETLNNTNGVLSTTKSTEYARVIIALSCLGIDASNYTTADGNSYNLTSPLADFNFVKKQGINGAIYSLIALDTNNYTIPTNLNDTIQTTRDGIIEYIISQKLDTGGWNLTGSIADVDITAMTIQALSPYYNTNQEVHSAIDEALTVLSDMQLPDGGYSSLGNENSESVAQVLCALCSLGINPATDERYIKGQNWLVSNLMENYAISDETNNTLSFSHLPNGEVNQVATEQVGYSLTAYYRLLNGKSWLYDCTPTKEYTIGDINQDGKVSTADLILLKKSLLASTTLNDVQKLSADINSDGKVSTADLILLKKRLLGIE